jgi:2-haloacid dehalogenase
MTVPDVDALVFDVFGTVVDWHSGVVRDGEKLGDKKGLDVDWAAFADTWREEYQPSMDRVRDGEIPWQNLDALHRDSLETLLDRFEIDSLTEEEVAHLNHVWHRLDPWPDSIPGLRRLRTHYLIAPLSNGHVRLLADMAKRARIRSHGI